MTAGSMRLILLPLFCLLQPQATLSAGQAALQNDSSSLCRAEEQIIFSCAVAPGARTVSLCASRILDHRRGYLQYRYGKPGVVEQQFPRERANTQMAFRYAHYVRAQAERSEITFDHNDYRYVIFDYYEGDSQRPMRQAGVAVQRHGNRQNAQRLSDIYQ